MFHLETPYITIDGLRMGLLNGKKTLSSAKASSGKKLKN